MESSPRILTRLDQHAQALNVARSTFHAALPGLMANGYPARWIGRLLVAEYDAVMNWLAAGETQPRPASIQSFESDPQSLVEGAMTTVPKRKRGRPRKQPLVPRRSS